MTRIGFSLPAWMWENNGKDAEREIHLACERGLQRGPGPLVRHIGHFGSSAMLDGFEELVRAPTLAEGSEIHLAWVGACVSGQTGKAVEGRARARDQYRLGKPEQGDRLEIALGIE